MDLKFEKTGWEQYLYWKSTDKKVSKKIDDLIKSIQRTPFEGIGKPEQLRGDRAGYWSRRINKEHRLVYCLQNNTLIIIQCRYHY